EAGTAAGGAHSARPDARVASRDAVPPQRRLAEGPRLQRTTGPPRAHPRRAGVPVALREPPPAVGRAARAGPRLSRPRAGLRRRPRDRGLEEVSGRRPLQVRPDPSGPDARALRADG